MLRFGVEIEVADISVDPNNDRTLRNTTRWEIKYDSSIQPSGLEFVSPIFEWENRGQVFDMVDRIKGKGKCNQSCGLHIHMSGEFGSSFHSVR